MINRQLFNKIYSLFFKQKVIIIFGPRQTGKTTLVKHIIKNFEGKSEYLNCDEKIIRDQLTDINSKQIKSLIGNNKVIVIDEAQRVKNIGLSLKIMIDNFPDIQIIATGSSSFELSNEINEPLTGRKFEFILLPFSYQELVEENGALSEKMQLENRVIYGNYPDVINNQGNEKLILNNLVNSYLFKDIFSFQEIRKPELIEKLLEALAFQVGSEVSYKELADTIGANTSTIQKYIQLLEKSFVIFRLRSLSRNARNELKKSRKIYFFDNGVRNAIIADYKPLNHRIDLGALWENFFVSERYKFLQYNQIFAKQYFWRTTQQQEVDYIEEYNEEIYAYEIKYNKNKIVKFPKTFLNSYNVIETNIVNSENYSEFLIN